MSLATSARSRLVTTTEAARLLNVSRRTVTNWINADLIPYVQLPGGEYRIPLAALLRSLGGTYDLANDLAALEATTRVGDVDEDEAVAALVGEPDEPKR